MERSTREDAHEISEGRNFSRHFDRLSILNLAECSKKHVRLAGDI
jgi:hypothetical protein